MSDITVHVTSSLTSSERRISTNWSFEHFKQRIETITGIPPEHQQLLLFPSNISTHSTDLTKSSETSTVGSLNVVTGSRIHVNDTRPVSEIHDLEDDSNVQGFELKDEDYDKRTDSVRRWKQDNKLGRFNPEYELKKQESKILNDDKAKELEIGKRFRSIDEINGERRGVIKYVGKVREIDEYVWVGVEFDEPVGKNDGSIKGNRYFDSKPNYGGFLKPVVVEQGDFPEPDLFASDDDEI